MLQVSCRDETGGLGRHDGRRANQTMQFQRGAFARHLLAIRPR